LRRHVTAAAVVIILGWVVISWAARVLATPLL
jgi:hypothetical protein